MSEELRTSRVKVFCPRCEEVYIPKKKCPDVDGAYFGCSFPSIFLMVILHILIKRILYKKFKFLQIIKHMYQEFLDLEYIRRKVLDIKINNKNQQKLHIIQKNNLKN